MRVILMQNRRVPETLVIYPDANHINEWSNLRLQTFYECIELNICKIIDVSEACKNPLIFPKLAKEHAFVPNTNKYFFHSGICSK